MFKVGDYTNILGELARQYHLTKRDRSKIMGEFTSRMERDPEQRHTQTHFIGAVCRVAPTIPQDAVARYVADFFRPEPRQSPYYLRF